MSYPGDPRVESSVQARAGAIHSASGADRGNLEEATAAYARLVEQARDARLQQQEQSYAAPDGGRGRDRSPNPATEY